MMYLPVSWQRVITIFFETSELFFADHLLVAKFKPYMSFNFLYQYDAQ